MTITLPFLLFSLNRLANSLIMTLYLIALIAGKYNSFLKADEPFLEIELRLYTELPDS